MGVLDKLRRGAHDVGVMATLFPAADGEAAADGVEKTDVQHLVLAACALEDGSAGRALAAVGTDLAGMRAAFAAQHDDALSVAEDDSIAAHLPPPVAAAGLAKSTTASHELFRGVYDEMKAAKGRLDGAWFLLVASEQHHGTFIRALAQLDVTPEQMREAAAAELGVA